MEAATRLRKTFRFDDEDHNEPEVIDEEEQDNIIEDLIARNSGTNLRYQLYFLALPILSIIPYVPILFTTQRLLALLSITSLACTAYLLHFLPPGKTGIPVIDGRNAGPQGKQREALKIDGRGPLLRYLPYLNLSLGGILLLLPLVAGGKSADIPHSQLLSYLPLAIYLFTLLVKIVMGSVDVEELEALKYNYKGA